jgi:hypothetical protein
MSTHAIWGKLDAADLPKIFPQQHLEGYSRFTLIPLFEALHNDFIEVIMKMEKINHLVHGYFSTTLNDQVCQFQLHVNNNEDLDEQDQDEIIWATGSFSFQWNVAWRSSAAGAYEEEEKLMTEFIEQIIAELAKANFDYADYKEKAITKLSKEKWHHLSPQVQRFYKRSSGLMHLRPVKIFGRSFLLLVTCIFGYNIIH